jgi:hypothetical protein
MPVMIDALGDSYWIAGATEPRTYVGLNAFGRDHLGHFSNLRS